MDFVVAWRSFINVLRPVSGLPQPLLVSREKQNSTNYHIQNPYRKNQYTFQYSLRGRGEISWHGKTYDVPQGHGFLVEMGDPAVVYYYPEEAQSAWEFVYFNFSGELAEQIAEISRRWGPVHALDLHRGLIQRLLEFEQYDEHGYNMTASRGMALVHELLQGIIKGHEVLEGGDKESFLVRRALVLLQSRLATGINAGELAGELGVTREHLSRLFKQDLGVSPYQYILNQRISLATRLLKNTTLHCKQIAQDCGFETSSLFNNAFKQVYGLTPRRYRQQSGG